MTPSMTDEMRAYAKKLLADTNCVIDEYVADIANREPEAINVADICCRGVKFCINDYGDLWVEVVSEEASPSCSEFNAFVRHRLERLGHKGIVSMTEW